ncbi:glycosyltransferase [Sphingobacterium corticibacter]|uniref:Glycosyl transferase family 1 n=1 Tax=Sphingobacterium corticibacter TaxID=2171749 RepID=A0A2T8HK41_9SPHI|nr:glycosyltransferase [Sphingobacterium corticibacter]PVH25827.1 glycosyl transferase family 1 [Sphingobacterium corticibacter]
MDRDNRQKGKILQIGKFYPIRGGVEKVMYDLMLGLSKRQIHCDMLCASTENYEARDIQLNEYARIIIVPTQLKLAATMLAPAMISKLRKIKKHYDAIHIHHPDPMACLSLFLSGYQGKVVLHWHSDIVKQKKLLLLYKPLQRWLIKRADIIVGTSPTYVQESPFLKKVQHKVTYIPIGVEPLQPQKSISQVIREKYTGKKIIFALGRLVEYKGYNHMIEAMKLLDDSYLLIIGGKGPLKEDLLALISRLDICNRVQLLDYIADDEVPCYFDICDIFCLSSTQKTEAFAIVQIEAMSLGKPVVSTHIEGSGVSWVNADGVSGFVVEKENPEALAKAIRHLAENQETYQKLSAGARMRYERLFTDKCMIDKTLQIYENIGL